MSKDDDREKTFILTDACMYEANKKAGTAHPHAIQVVDIETGSVRYIKSGSKIKFVAGEITVSHSQEDYNKQK